VCAPQVPGIGGAVDISKYLTLVGVIAAFISAFFSHGFYTLSRKLLAGRKVHRGCTRDVEGMHRLQLCEMKEVAHFQVRTQPTGCRGDAACFGCNLHIFDPCAWYAPDAAHSDAAGIGMRGTSRYLISRHDLRDMISVACSYT
jgi:hypothetical protein